MEPNGAPPGDDAGDRPNDAATNDLEDAFKHAVALRLSEMPRAGQHPLRPAMANMLEDTSENLAGDIDHTVDDARKKPAMASALLTGKTVSAGTSMKGTPNPTVHSVVQVLLDELSDIVNAKVAEVDGKLTEVIVELKNLRPKGKNIVKVNGLRAMVDRLRRTNAGKTDKLRGRVDEVNDKLDELRGMFDEVQFEAVKDMLNELRLIVDRRKDVTVGVGHGRCAEIAVISDYLRNVDPDQTMDVPRARAHFERVGGATAAHETSLRSGSDVYQLRTACDTCAYVARKLVIATLESEY